MPGKHITLWWIIRPLPSFPAPPLEFPFYPVLTPARRGAQYERKFWRKTLMRLWAVRGVGKKWRNEARRWTQGGDRRQLAAERKGEEDIRVWRLNSQDCTCLTRGPIPSEAWVPSEARDSVLVVDQFEATGSAAHRNTPVLSFCVMRLRNDWVTRWAFSGHRHRTPPPTPLLQAPVGLVVPSQRKAYCQDLGCVFAIQDMYKGTRGLGPRTLWEIETWNKTTVNNDGRILLKTRDLN